MMDNYLYTVNQVNLLYEIDEDYDDEFWYTKGEVIEKCLSILETTFEYLQDTFPKGYPAPNGLGGMSIEWRNKNRYIKLNLSQDNKIHIFIVSNFDSPIYYKSNLIIV